MSFDYSKYVDSGDYIKFDEVGDSVVGIIKERREGRDYKGNPCPELILEVDGMEKILTAGQVMLKAKLAEEAPDDGDKVRITYSGNGEGRPGQNPAKLFTVEVKRGPHELQNAEVAAAPTNDDAPF